MLIFTCKRKCIKSERLQCTDELKLRHTLDEQCRRRDTEATDTNAADMTTDIQEFTTTDRLLDKQIQTVMTGMDAVMGAALTAL